MHQILPRLRRVAVLGLLMGTASAIGVTAADYLDFAEQPQFSYTTPDDTVRVKAGIGAIYLEGNEYVFNGARTLSHLIWQSRAPTLRGSIAVDVGGGFSLSAEGNVAAFGSSYMEDYGWLVATNSFDAWTHRSQHPDTDLDHYWTGAAAVGFELAKDDKGVVRLHSGFKYTDVQWSAYGGSYVYSTGGGFRNSTGNFVDGAPAIRYRQQIPEIFVGFDGEERYGNIRVGGLLRGGLTVFTKTTDNHWMRDLLVIDTLRVTPTLSLGADVGFALGPQAEIYLAGRYDHTFQMRGQAEYFNTTTGVRTIVGDDIGGADFKSVEVTAGLRAAF